MHVDAHAPVARPVSETTGDCAACGGPLPPVAEISGVDRLLGTPGVFGVRICPSCRSGRTTPEVDEAGLAAFYEGDYLPTSGYQARSVLALLSALQRGAHRRRTVRTRPVSLVAGRPGVGLDVGCGRGDLGAGLIGRGWTMHGLDPSPTACEEAAAAGLRVQQATLGAAGFPDGASFDAVFFRHSLEHVVDPGADLRRARDLLTVGGHVVVEVPNFACWQRVRFADRWFHLDLPRHRTHFTPEGLRQLATASGLVVEHLSTGTSTSGLIGSLQYAVFGRWRASGPVSSRMLVVGASLSRPLAAVIDRIGGGGDMLYLVARKPS